MYTTQEFVYAARPLLLPPTRTRRGKNKTRSGRPHLLQKIAKTTLRGSLKSISDQSGHVPHSARAVLSYGESRPSQNRFIDRYRCMIHYNCAEREKSHAGTEEIYFYFFIVPIFFFLCTRNDVIV